MYAISGNSDYVSFIGITESGLIIENINKRVDFNLLNSKGGE